MSNEELMKLSLSYDEGPFDHQEYTIWLHNKIVQNIMYEIWQFREQKAISINGEAACNHIMNLPSLKII